MTDELSFPDRTTLSARDRRVVRAIAEAMFSGGAPLDRARIEAHVDDVDRFVSAASRPIRFGLRVALLFVQLAPMLFFFRARTLDRLSLGDRVTFLDRLERSRVASLSLAFIGWRTVMTLLFYEDPLELGAIGYSDERKRHVRLPLVAPPPLESGVRLGDGVEEEAPDSAREVA